MKFCFYLVEKLVRVLPERSEEKPIQSQITLETQLKMVLLFVFPSFFICSYLNFWQITFTIVQDFRI